MRDPREAYAHASPSSRRPAHRARGPRRPGPVTGRDPVTGTGAGAPAAAPPAGAHGGRAAARRAARSRRRAAKRPERLRKLLPRALVVAFLAGGTSAFISHDKAVRLTVDGTPRTVHTFADDVGELLAEEDMEVGRHDVVAPSPGKDLASGDEVTVRYGRRLTLTLDGRRRTVWTTARTVQEALRALGVRTEGARLSVSRSTPIGRAGLSLDVLTERSVTLLADGRQHTVRTNAATVREMIAEAGLALHGQDAASVPLESFPRDGQTVTVLRVSGGRQVREEPIGFDTLRREDSGLHRGTEVVVQPGRTGVQRITYGLRTVNGVRQKPKRLGAEVLRQPEPRIVTVGTRPLPTSVAGTDSLDWEALAQCESGGRPHAVDPSGTYGGLYQFDAHTWHSLGGTGRPEEASPAEQTYRAKKLYVLRGSSPWPVCGRKLHR